MTLKKQRAKKARWIREQEFVWGKDKFAISHKLAKIWLEDYFNLQETLWSYWKAQGKEPISLGITEHGDYWTDGWSRQTYSLLPNGWTEECRESYSYEYGYEEHVSYSKERPSNCPNQEPVQLTPTEYVDGRYDITKRHLMVDADGNKYWQYYAINPLGLGYEEDEEHLAWTAPYKG